MKRNLLFVLVSSLFTLCFFSGIAVTQERSQSKIYRTTTLPLEGTTPEQAYRDSQAGATLPMWEYSVKSPADGRNYKAWILGRKPSEPGPDAEGTTPIPTIIIPLRVELLDEKGKFFRAYDPTKADKGCLKDDKRSPLQLVWDSPLFNDTHYVWDGTDIGTTQYVDAQLRGEFWKLLQAAPSPWHNKFVKQLAGKQTVKVPKEFWSQSLNGCDDNAEIDDHWFDNYIKYTLIPSVKLVNPATLPLILTYQVSTTVAGGYHSAFGQPVQVYAFADFMNASEEIAPDISILSHELAEVVNNPLTSNGAPSWGRIGQQHLCQGDLEVGDNLVPIWYPPIKVKGFTYHPQELSFVSWFYRSGNVGVNTWYSNNDSLVVDAGEVCSRFGPQLVVDPDWGLVATPVTATLSRLPARKKVSIYFNGELVDTVWTDRLGKVETTFLSPETPSGEREIVASWDQDFTYAWFLVPSQ